MGFASTLKKGVGKGLKQLASKQGKKLLKNISRQVKGRVKNFIEAKCPQCKAAGHWVHKASKIPVVKKGLEKVENVVRKKCKTCGEVLDIVQA